MKVIAFIGQSLPNAMFNLVTAPLTPAANTYVWNGSTWATPVGDGIIAYLNGLAGFLAEPIYAINCCVDGMPLLQTAGSTDWWLNTASGSIINLAIAKIQAALASLPSGTSLDRIEFWEGQTDSLASASYGPYYAGLGTFQGLLQTPLGTGWKLCIWPVGKVNGGSTQGVIHAQMDFAQSDPVHLEPGPASYDLLYADGIHLYDGVQYAVMGVRGARNAKSSFANIAAGTGSQPHHGAGPSLSSAVRNNTMVMLGFKVKTGHSLQPRDFWAPGDIDFCPGFVVWWFNYSSYFIPTDARIVGNRVRLIVATNLVWPIHAAWQWDWQCGGVLYDSNDELIPGWGQPLLPSTPEMILST